jgi:hypothetical protein
MTLTFDLDTERDNPMCADDDPIDTAFELIAEGVVDLEPRAALRRVRRYRASLSAIETRLVRGLIRDDGDDRAAKRALNDGKTSRAAIARATRRAAAAKENASLADKVESGELSEEQLDVIADASAKTNGAAAVDAAFIDKIADVDPDQGRALADEFVAEQATPGGTKTEHDRQRALRRASNYNSKKTGLNAIGLEGDSVAGKDMWNQIEKRADELYEADGGRDVPGQLHPRTRAQLLFDAAHELICNVTTTPTGISRTPRYDSSTKPGRPQIFVGMTFDHYLGLDPSAVATQIGLGQIPDSVLAEYLEHADILGVLYDSNGQPLWLGRAKRHASLMQRYALILRDRHCVLCGADHSRCQVHHTMPWNAPGKGETNLDQLALLCGPCHRRLHADNHTIYRDATATWRTRPATPHETPPQRTDHPQRE